MSRSPRLLFDVPFRLRAIGVFVALVGLFAGALPAAAIADAPTVKNSAVTAQSPSNAAGTAVRPTSLVGFDPGNIMDDAVFFNSGSMTEGQVQAFLELRVASCVAGYTCLKNFRQTTPTREATPMCAGRYAGGADELASRIIFKVSQACGINPQVLIVMLQKEQGLVTHRDPSDWRYRIAMGQGCPDTAACDTRYYGFVNQVYGAASQMKRYSNPPGTSNFFNWYAPGKTWNIGFNPNAACGSSPVYIQNQATSNLYYYTPYQPSKAALAAGYGEAAGGCHAYGNRNFYNYFTDWFGSTRYVMPVTIRSEWDRLGGQSGVLGSPTGGAAFVSANGGGQIQQFVGAPVFAQSRASRAFALMNTSIRYSYLAVGGAGGTWGWPTSDHSCGLEADGCYQSFQLGTAVSTPTTGSQLVPTPMFAAWGSIGGLSGPVGYPVGAARSANNGAWAQAFQGGDYLASAAGKAFRTNAQITDNWIAAGGTSGYLGMPTGDANVVSGSGGGSTQEFTGGTIYSSPNGLFGLSSQFRANYLALGGPAGSAGWPAGSAVCALAGGGCTMPFQYGVLIYGPSTGSVLVPEAVLGEWMRLGGPQAFGYPTAASVALSANGGGSIYAFESGTIFQSSGGAAAGVDGQFGANYLALGGPGGSTGWPTGPRACDLPGAGCTMPVQNGTVIYGPATGSVLVAAVVEKEWRRAGGVGALGYPSMPTQNLRENGGGSVTTFQTGAVYSSAKATVALSGQFRANYLALGGAQGEAGWPTGAVSCALAGGGCQMATQNGALVYGTNTGSVLLKEPVRLEWERTGGVDNLGYPIAAPTATPTGQMYRFQRGSILLGGDGSAVTQ